MDRIEKTTTILTSKLKYNAISSTIQQFVCISVLANLLDATSAAFYHRWS